MASLKPLRLSTQVIRMSSTPRLFSSFSTVSQNLDDSFSPIQMPSTSLQPSRSIPTTICGLIDHLAILLHFVVDSIKEHHGVNGLQWPVLPFSDEGQQFIRDIGDECRRDFETVQLIKVRLNIPCTDATSVHRNDLFLDAGSVCLVLLDDLRLKLAFAVSGNSNLYF